MQPKCVLVADGETRFVRPLRKFQKYLQSIGCDAEFHELSDRGVLRAITRAARATPADQPFLLVYSGHGHRLGWKGKVSYLSLLWSLSKIRGELIVINDTCYGYHFLNYLKLIRSAKNTCFISPWDSRNVSYGGPVRDSLAYWPLGVVPEEVITSNTYSSSEGDVEVPLQLRWGSVLDHRFFPA